MGPNLLSTHGKVGRELKTRGVCVCVCVCGGGGVQNNGGQLGHIIDNRTAHHLGEKHQQTNKQTTTTTNPPTKTSLPSWLNSLSRSQPVSHRACTCRSPLKSCASIIFVATNTWLLRQTSVCYDKRCLLSRQVLSRQAYFCHVFVATKACLSRQNTFVATNTTFSR